MILYLICRYVRTSLSLKCMFKSVVCQKLVTTTFVNRIYIINRSHTADGQSEDNPVILQPSDVNNPLAYEENLPYDDYLLNENFITFLTRPKSLQRMRPNINGYDFEEDNTKP